MRMLRIFVFHCAIGLSVVFLCATAQAITYDFEDAKQKDEWEDLRGETEIVDGLLCEMGTANLPLISVIKDWNDEWTDYTITVKAQGLIADADWGIVFRVQVSATTINGNSATLFSGLSRRSAVLVQRFSPLLNRKFWKNGRISK